MAAENAGEQSSDLRSDLELIDAINAGDARAFESLYTRHKQWIVNMAYRFTRDREIALDVLQETFLYVLGKFPGFELHCRFRTFLYPVVRNISITHQSKSRRTPKKVSGPLSESEKRDLSPVSELRGLHEAVDDLPVGQREVVFLRFADDLPLAEIGMALGIPEGTVKSRLHHALRTLREDPRARGVIDD